jgi:DNA-binding NtrC family response regulator
MKKKMTILVVDDDAAVRRVLTRVLTASDCEVTSAANAWEALEAIEKTCFSAAFIDVNLGAGPDGITLADMLRERCPGSCIVVMSGDPQNASVVEEHGFGPMLEKPVISSAIIQALGSASTSQDDNRTTPHFGMENE